MASIIPSKSTQDADAFANLHGQLLHDVTPSQLAELLVASKFEAHSNRYGVRLKSASHFIFDKVRKEYIVHADGPSVESLAQEARSVSAALARSQIRHRFEMYCPSDKLAEYLHYEWPPS